jgi:hypothetical protein
MVSENPTGADNQQETAQHAGSSETVRGAPFHHFRSGDPNGGTEKIQSDPHGDMGSWAEMTQPVSVLHFDDLLKWIGTSNNSA